MKPKLLLASLIGLAATLNPATSSADNLLMNGGFNALGFPYPNDMDQILAPWRWSGEIGYVYGNGDVRVGPGVTLDSGGTVGFWTGLIYQDVTTAPGQSYTHTITAHARGTAPGTWLQPLWNGVALSPRHAEYFEWTTVGWDVQASGPSTRLTIETAPNQLGWTWIDSVSLVAIPEPSFSRLALAALAVAALLPLRRRKSVPALPHGTNEPDGDARSPSLFGRGRHGWHCRY